MSLKYSLLLPSLQLPPTHPPLCCSCRADHWHLTLPCTGSGGGGGSCTGSGCTGGNGGVTQWLLCGFTASAGGSARIAWHLHPPCKACTVAALVQLALSGQLIRPPALLSALPGNGGNGGDANASPPKSSTYHNSYDCSHCEWFCIVGIRSAAAPYVHGFGTAMHAQNCRPPPPPVCCSAAPPALC